jgi:hypothetical protein
MTCLRAEQIYEFLENELPEKEVQALQEHISGCPACQRAVEERRLFLNAANSLPAWEVPQNFAARTTALIVSEKTSLKNVFSAFLTGFSVMLVFLFGFFLFSGQNLMSFLIGLNKTLMGAAKNTTLALAKFFKIASIAFKVVRQFFGYLLEVFTHLTSMLGPEFHFALIAVTLITSVILILRLRKKSWTGEKA